MGKVTGFLELQRIPGGVGAGPAARAPLSRVHRRAQGRRGREAGRALHGLRHPVLPDRLPGPQHHPGLERPRVPPPVAARARRAALDEQLPRVHRPRMPGAVRGGVHAQHQQRSGRHQVDRALPDRQGLGGGLGRAAAAGGRRPASASPSSVRGPAGMACAQQLARAGHDVVLFEKADRIGGLLRYGIPDFKMEKHLIDRRMAQMAEEGVEFRPERQRRRRRRAADAARGVRRDRADRRRRGAARPAGAGPRARTASTSRWSSCRSRTRSSPAMRCRDRSRPRGKHVVVIGGGDTGSDCVGTSNRQGATSVTQFELLPQPPEVENKPLVWPYWPIKLRTSSSHEEGVNRDWAVATKRFEGHERQGREARRCAGRMEEGRRRNEDGRGARQRVRDPGRPRAARDGLRRSGARRASSRNSASRATRARTSRPTPTTTARRSTRSSPPATCAAGQSLVVWAIREGRQCARADRRVPDGRVVPAALTGRSDAVA